MYTYAQLAFALGRSEDALAYAKRYVRLNYRAWSTLESHCGSRVTVSRQADLPHDSGELSDSFSNLAISVCQPPPVKSTTHEALRTAPFWSLVPSIYRGLTYLSKIFAHEGLFQEADYYVEQAQKIASAVRATPWTVQSIAMSGNNWARSGSLQHGKALLMQSEQMSSDLKIDTITVVLHSQLANLYRLQCSWKEEAQAYGAVHKLLEGLTTEDPIHGVKPRREDSVALVEQISSLTLHDHQPPPMAPTRHQEQKSAQREPLGRTQAWEKLAQNKPSFAGHCTALMQLKGEALRQQAMSLLCQQQLDLAELKLSEAMELPTSQHGRIQQH